MAAPARKAASASHLFSSDASAALELREWGLSFPLAWETVREPGGDVGSTLLLRNWLLPAGTGCPSQGSWGGEPGPVLFKALQSL